MSKVTSPGIYDDIPEADYHADPCPQASVSAGFLKKMADETPLHAWTSHPRLNPDFKPKEAERFDIGSAGHSMMLRDPKDFAVIDAADYRSKAAQQQRDEARAAGAIPLLREQFERVTEMVQVGRDQMANSIDFAQVFQNGKPEVTLIWTEGEGRDQIWCRARPDWLYDNYATSGIFDDYKTSEVVNPSAWVRTIMLGPVRHDIQAAWYRRGIRALGLHRNPRMRFIIQEPSEPFALSGVEVSGEILELADREIEREIARFRMCRAMNRWPGYPAKFHRAQAPEYLEARRMEKEVARDELAKEAGGESQLFEQSFRRQAPEPVL